MNTPVKHQSGFVLVTAMILLIVLASLGMMALRSSFFETSIAGNTADQALAKEYAEMALRDAERDIMGLRFDGQFCAAVACSTLRPDGTRPKSAAEGNFWGIDKAVDGDVALDGGGIGKPAEFQGVYDSNAAIQCGKPVWAGANWLDAANPPRTCSGSIGVPIATVPYGTFTDAPFVGPDGNAVQGVPPPRYLIEVFPAGPLLQSSSQKIFFRITAVGFGRTSGPSGRTSVTLQSIFSPV
jgi:type IV pilus assembly protein PilX